MVVNLLTPVQTFVDADGRPYAGGTIGTYVPGTTTPKTTYVDHLGQAANPNPVVLDAAGRCIMHGDGEYRLILHDIAGNLIWDQWSTTLVSLAMQPVVAAPDLATARRLMGIDDAIAAAVAVETARAQAAEAALQAAINAVSGPLQTAIDAETARAEAAEAQLQANIIAEQNARIFTDGELNARITNTAGGSSMRVGAVTTDANGYYWVGFNPAFANELVSFTVASTQTQEYRADQSITNTRSAVEGYVWMKITGPAPGEGGGTTESWDYARNVTVGYWGVGY